jgi:ribosomal protein S18 acetylase RimI-like enzyme
MIQPVKISIVKNITDREVENLSALLPQLSPTANALNKQYLETILNSETMTLFVAKEGGLIVGTLSLILYLTLLNKKAWIEDVVVDKAVRGRGIAGLLLDAALDYAKKQGIKKIDLTSANNRVSAHELYKKRGFQKRDTSVFRIELTNL